VYILYIKFKVLFKGCEGKKTEESGIERELVAGENQMPLFCE